MLKYLAVDIETTGLVPERDQVLEIGMVAEIDWQTPVEKLPYLRIVLRRERIEGAAEALHLNARLLAELARFELEYERDQRSAVDAFPQVAWPDEVGPRVRGFVNGHFGVTDKVTLAGKNAAGFDLPFLRRLEHWPDRRFRHRVLDVGSLFVELSDPHLPDTAECMRRAGLPGSVPHSALADARLVVQMIRRRFAQGALPVMPVPFVGAPLAPAMAALAEIDDAA